MNPSFSKISKRPLYQKFRQQHLFLCSNTSIINLIDLMDEPELILKMGYEDEIGEIFDQSTTLLNYVIYINRVRNFIIIDVDQAKSVIDFMKLVLQYLQSENDYELYKRSEDVKKAGYYKKLLKDRGYKPSKIPYQILKVLW